MSVLTSVGILILAMLILAFLQLVPGIFALFSHQISGKYSKLRASDLTTFFILGAETAIVLVFLLIYFILNCSPSNTLIIESPIFAWSIAGIFCAFALISLLFYFRKGSGTKLFVSRKFITNLTNKIPTVKTRSDAFSFGLASTIPELIFTIPIYLITDIEIMQLGATSFDRAALIILTVIIAISPILIIHALFNTNYNLADFIRFRFKNKNFFRFCLSLFYFLIAILIILGLYL